MLDDEDLWTEEVSVTFAELKIICNDVFTNEVTVNVGQKISLEASFEPYVFDNVDFQWDIPGYNNFTPDVIKNYITTVEQGTIDELAFDDLTGSTVVFYFVKALINRNIECTASFGEHMLSKTIKFDVQKPSCTFTSALTTNIPAVCVTNFISHCELSLGVYPESPGIEWVPSVTTAENGSGKIALLQLIDFDLETNSSNNNFTVTSGDKYILDAGINTDTYEISILYGALQTDIGQNETKVHKDFWPFESYIADTPSIDLRTYEIRVRTLTQIPDVNLLHLSRSDQFKIYLVYKPDGDDNIWVPLNKMTWFWSGVTSKGTNGIWTLDSGSSPATAPVGYDTYDLPEWDSNFIIENNNIIVN